MNIKDYELKGGEAIFTYKDNWLNKSIAWFSKWRVPKGQTEKIAHVALYLGEFEKGPMIAEADWRGIVIRKAKIYNKKKYVIHAAMPMGIGKGRVFINRMRLYRYAMDKKGESYAYRQLAALAFKKLFGLNKIGDWDRDSMICSEFYSNAIADCFQIAVKPGKKSYDLTPLDIYYSDAMQILKAKKIN